MPVTADALASGTCDHVDHMLRRVCFSGAGLPIASKVLLYAPRVVSDVAKVNCSSSGGQEQESIELGK